MWKQIVNFDINKMGSKIGYCLANVRAGFGIPPKNESAKADMLENKNNGTLHDMSTLPENVAVPVYVDSSSIYEHIIVYDRGIFYSDGKRLTSVNGLRFFGWGETCNGVRIVENVGKIRVQAHIQDKGWTDWKNQGELIGTEGESKRLEAIKIETDDDVDIKYRVHVQDKGWMEWKKKGDIAGTTGESLRIEAIEIESSQELRVQEHIENIGWLPCSRGKNIFIGTVGKSLRLEAFKIY